MKSTATITVDEWLHELERIAAESGDTEGFVTVAELKEQIGHGEEWVRERLKQAQKIGALEVRGVMRRNIVGSWHSVPGYRLVKPNARKAVPCNS